MVHKNSETNLVWELQGVFSNYYRLLEQAIEKNWGLSADGTDVEIARLEMDSALNKFWYLPEFSLAADKEEYLKKVQERLRKQGFYLDLTPQYGIKTGSLNFQTLDKVSLNPIISQTEQKVKIGGQEISYTESILGENLIQLPHFIHPIVEAASSAEIVIFSYDLMKTLQDDYGYFEEYKDDVNSKFQPGLIDSDNLFCITIKLYEKQWGAKAPGNSELKLLVDHFRLHGQQHVIDFQLISSGKLHFIAEDPSMGDEALNKDSLLEARVMVRQLLENSLPFYVLSQIITFQREWLEGSRSEYAWAGHILFEGLAKKLGPSFRNGMPWVSGVDTMTEQEIGNLARRFTFFNTNFTDLLSDEQLKELQ